MTDKGINIPKMKEMIDESFSDKKMREDLHEHVVDCEKFAVRIIYHLKSFITFFLSPIWSFQLNQIASNAIRSDFERETTYVRKNCSRTCRSYGSILPLLQGNPIH